MTISTATTAPVAAKTLAAAAAASTTSAILAVNLVPEAHPAPLVTTFGLPDRSTMPARLLRALPDYMAGAEPLHHLGWGAPGSLYEAGVFFLKRPDATAAVPNPSLEVFFVVPGSADHVRVTFISETSEGSNIGGLTPLRDGAFFLMDTAGNEVWQLHYLEYPAALGSRGAVRPIDTDGRVMAVRPLGDDRIAYSSSKRNNRDSDIYVRSAINPSADDGSEFMLVETDGMWAVADYAADADRALLAKYKSASDMSLFVVSTKRPAGTDAAPYTAADMTPLSVADRPVVLAGARWLDPSAASKILFITNAFTDFDALCEFDLATSTTSEMVSSSGNGLVRLEWDVESFDVVDDHVYYFANEDGWTTIFDLNMATSTVESVPTPVPGIFGECMLKKRAAPLNGKSSLACVAINSPASPGSLMTVDLATREWITLVASPATPAYPVTIPSIIRCASFDGELVPAFVYARQDMLDKTDASVPVVIYIHGGPESQFVPNFVPANHTLSFQFLLNEMGVAVIAPNVRGSRGYGTRYMKADDQMKREDSVRDIGAILDWIAAHPSLDSKRVCVMGRSYGGYMVLASLVHYSPRLACGVATCGISDFVTFLESTAPFRRDLRRPEYGDERIPEMRAFLHDISPLTHTDKITVPLFMGQGENDVRVPLNEAIQMANKLDANGVPCWLFIGEKEGHVFKQTSVQEQHAIAMVHFLDTFLTTTARAAKE